MHRVVAALFEQQLRIIDSHTYENLDEDGEPLLDKALPGDGATESNEKIYENLDDLGLDNEETEKGEDFFYVLYNHLSDYLFPRDCTRKTSGKT